MSLKQLKVSPAKIRRRKQELIKRYVIHIAAIPDADKTGYTCLLSSILRTLTGRQMKNLGEVSSFSGGELLLGLLNRRFGVPELNSRNSLRRLGVLRRH